MLKDRIHDELLAPRDSAESVSVLRFAPRGSASVLECQVRYVGGNFL